MAADTVGQDLVPPGIEMDELLSRKRAKIRRIAARHGAHNVRLFGSRARGDARPDSDIDLLVETRPVTSSWFPAGLILDLENELGCRVQVVTERALNPDVREQVLREAVRV
jgi:predicted nucleotidyltransferase